jgi:hypothetical protein
MEPALSIEQTIEAILIHEEVEHSTSTLMRAIAA